MRLTTAVIYRRIPPRAGFLAFYAQHNAQEYGSKVEHAPAQALTKFRNVVQHSGGLNLTPPIPHATVSVVVSQQEEVMQCPKCKQGTIRQAPVGSSQGISLVCDYPRCFTWFTGRPGGTAILEDTRVTERMRETIPVANRSAAVSAYPQHA